MRLSNSILTKWSSLIVQVETPNTFAFADPVFNSVIVPKRVFQSEEDIGAFRELAQRMVHPPPSAP